MRARRIARSASLWLRMPASSRASLVTRSAANCMISTADMLSERQAGEGELLAAHLFDHPARQHLPRCPRSKAAPDASQVRRSRPDLQRGDLRGEQARRAQYARYEKQGGLWPFIPPRRDRSAADLPAVPINHGRCIRSRHPSRPVPRPGAVVHLHRPHPRPTSMSWFTVRNYGFSDATEIFVFISGYTAVIAYSRMMQRDGWTRALRSASTAASGSSMSPTSCCSSPSPPRSPRSRSPATRRR